MTDIVAGYRSIDMTAWYFSSLKSGEFHGEPDSNLNAIRITADNPDPYSHASLFPELYTVYIRLIGDGFGVFDDKGVPHSGVLSDAVMFTAWYAVTVEFHSLSVAVEDFLDAVGSQSPTQLTNLLTAGNDFIVGFTGDGGDGLDPAGDHLIGAAGDDLILGHGGRDTIEGGDGDDWIQTVDTSTQDYARSHAASVDGGPGIDTIDYENAPFGVVAHLDGTAGTDVITNVERAIGSGYADTISGSAGSDVIFGGEGQNFLTGGDGADEITGGSNFDRMNGNAGNDTVHGLGGDDWVTGGKDDDLLYGDDNADILNGNLGSDTADGGDGDDTVRGGQGDDLLIGGLGDDFLTGDLGNDTMTGGGGADVFRVFNGGGEDRITDFNAADGDRVRLDPGTIFTLSQVGADTVIDLGGGHQTVLVGVTLADLPSTWIFGR